MALQVQNNSDSLASYSAKYILFHISYNLKFPVRNRGTLNFRIFLLHLKNRIIVIIRGTRMWVVYVEKIKEAPNGKHFPRIQWN